MKAAHLKKALSLTKRAKGIGIAGSRREVTFNDLERLVTFIEAIQDEEAEAEERNHRKSLEAAMGTHGQG